MDPTERGVDTDRLRRDIEATRASLSGTADELRRKAGEAMKWQTYVERYPVPILAASALVGLAVGRRIGRALHSGDHRGDRAPVDGRRRRHQDPGGGLEAAGRADRFAAVSASWQRLGSRVEGLVNRVIDDVADATERALVPAIVGGVQALFEGHARRGDRRTAWDSGPTAASEEGGLT